MFNDPKVNGEKYLLKAVKVDDLNTLDGLYESKEIKTEDTTDEFFPSTKFTAQWLSADQLRDFNVSRDLTIDQIAWVQANIGNIYEVEDGVRHFISSIDNLDLSDQQIIKLDDYFNNLKDALKGE